LTGKLEKQEMSAENKKKKIRKTNEGGRMVEGKEDSAKNPKEKYIFCFVFVFFLFLFKNCRKI